MNRQKKPKGIEWTRIKKTAPDGNLVEVPGYTWNPTGGCFHGCTWEMPDGSVTECYAKTIAERFSTIYKKGFEHHYWRPHMLKQPLRLQEPSGIFVGSMADLFGHWVEAWQIEKVLAAMTEAYWHTFQTLSKHPARLPEFNPFPDNVWVGVSLPAGHQMSVANAERALMKYLRQMEQVEAEIRFMSIEPLWFDAAPVYEAWLNEHDNLPFDWAIIGAASDGRKLYQPEPAWTQALLDLFDAEAIPVFFKGNMDWPDTDWRDSFPDTPLVERKPEPAN